MIVDVTAPGAEPLLHRAVDRFRGGGDPQAYLEADGALAFVAVDGDVSTGADREVLGWCWGYLLGRPDGLAMAYIHEVEVAAEARRAGHGRALVQAFLEAASDAGATKAFLVTEVDNVAARALYESTGGRPPEHGPVTSYWFALP